jgi:hypothetical protein
MVVAIPSRNAARRLYRSLCLFDAVSSLFALAIYLARGERRQTIRNIGFAFVLVGLTVLAVRRLAGNVAIDALPDRRARRRVRGHG